jgi:tol-pal system protein YbgF
MTKHAVPFAVAIAMTAASVLPAAAQSKEQRQLMADVRILQEHSQELHNLLDQLTETLKAVNARLDDQANATRKAFADQKLTIDTLSSDVRVVREKIDDNNVRIGSLTQELESVRRTVQSYASGTPPVQGPPAAADNTPGGEGQPGSPAEPAASAPAPVALGTSPQRAWDTAYSDYVGGQYDLAVLGFEAYIRDFPTSDMADNAQVLIGKSLMLDNKYDKAVEAFDKVIRNYPAGDAVSEAYYQEGVSLQHLGQNDKAREAWDTVIKKYPDSTPATLAKQKLTQAAKP